MKLIRTALAVVVAILAVGVASAQTGTMSVSVTDSEGEMLPGATVTISNETGYIKTTAVLTDKKGVALFPVLRPGSGYSIVVSFPGYNSIREAGIKVPLGDPVRLSIRMLEEFEEKVKVTAQRDVIDLEQTEQSTKFSENFISDLPVPGRFYQNVLTMAPGVQDADGDGNPNVHGSRSRDFQAVVSGVSNVDPLTGQWQSNVNPNSIEEMEVVTAGAGVEFGRAQGGFARIIQKQGSNTHEGVAEFYYRSSLFDGTGANNLSALPDPDFTWIQPSIQVSGPILKDKFWYRASLEYRNIESPIVTGTGTELFTREEHTRDVQLTWQVSPRNKLALNWRADPRLWSNVNVSSAISSDSSLGVEWDGATSSLTWTAPFSPRVLVESTVAWTDQNVAVFPNTVGVPNDCVGGSDEGTPGWLSTAQCFDVDQNQVTGSAVRTNDDQRQRLTVKGKATVYGGRFWGMTHQFKVGVQVENERYFRNLERLPSVVHVVLTSPQEASDADVDTPDDGGVQAINLWIPTVFVPQSDDVRATGSNWGFYAEDQFKPKQNMTITLGVRVDNEEITAEGRQPFDPQTELDNFVDAIVSEPFFDENNISQEVLNQTFPSYFTGYEGLGNFTDEMVAILCDQSQNFNVCKTETMNRVETLFVEDLEQNRVAQDQFIKNTNFSPYLSFAWSPFSNGKTAFKFAVGRHYNNIPLLIPLQELEPAAVTVNLSAVVGSNEAPNLGSISPTVDVTVVDRDLRTPYQDEFTFSIERELWAETSLNLTYINRQFKDQIQDVNINVAEGDYGQCVPQSAPQNPSVIEQWGTGDRVDAYTGEQYFDDNEGPGDGRIDDCIGNSVPYFEGTENDPPFLVVPDGTPDLYRLNPFWGDIYLVGNFNEIDYQAWIIEIVRRQYRSWEMNASYTWSEAQGDGEDFFQGIGDDPTTREDAFGYQSYDQRHVVKFNATTTTPWGVRVGTAISWQSGLPFSILYAQAARDGVPFWTDNYVAPETRTRFSYPTGGRNTERNASYWNVDLRASKEFNLGRGLNMQVSAEIFNLLNDGTYQVYNPGNEAGQQVNGVNESQRRFGRQWQVGLRLAF